MAKRGKPRIVVLCFVLFFAVPLLLAPAASADDAEQLKYLPGQWRYSREVVEKDAAPEETDLLLTLGENGELSLSSMGRTGGVEYTYAGTWSSEFVPDALDRLTLEFTSTDNPLYRGSPYNVKCVYDFYTESWVEKDTWNIWLILEESASGGSSPFEEIISDNNPALHREQAPDMRVVRCKDFVSLRSGPSTSSKRLAKVSLGALVLALPGAEEKNGFLWCSYHDQTGYILSEYLEPVSPPAP